jgi:ABC-type uncharacterized transport system substrate-binding protein
MKEFWIDSLGIKSAFRNLKFAILLGAMLFALCFPVEAQQGKIYRIGVLAQSGKAEERLEIKRLRAGLAEAKYIEGKNLELNIPNVKTYDELRPIAKGYVERKVDVIVTNGGTATEIANRATKEIPVVFIWGVTDPCRIRTCKVSGSSRHECYRFDQRGWCGNLWEASGAF